MIDGSDSLSADEFLLRRIPAIHVSANLPRRIDPDHFNPHPERDIDGISVYREMMVSDRELVARALGKGPYYVAKAKVEELMALGLCPMITLDAQDGHVSLPELSWQAVHDNDEALRITKLQLAELMSKRIVLGPITPAGARTL